MRIKVLNIDETVEADKTAQTVTQKTVSSEWYAPKLIGDTLFYSDSSDYGHSYIKCINLNNEIIADYDDDGEISGYHLEGEVSLAKMLDKDTALVAETYIADVKLNSKSEL
ncbi:MAG: hypothetical protein J6Y43_03175, partial [Clostridia bacterium]|nr:hypothetical protein [Clostridia bacterium]